MLPVYVVDTRLGMPDPHVQGAQFHQALYIQTQPASEPGLVMHMTGSISDPRGMSYEQKVAEYRLDDDVVIGCRLLGRLAEGDVPALDAVLRALATPPRQKASNVARMGAYEPFRIDAEGQVAFYSREELNLFEFPPLKECRWWMQTLALPAVEASGLVRGEEEEEEAGEEEEVPTRQQQSEISMSESAHVSVPP